MRQSEWRRVAGFRVVLSWPSEGYSEPPRRPGRGWASRLAGLAGTGLIVFGLVAILVVFVSQKHAPKPSASAAGTTGVGRTIALRRSVPMSVSIPAISLQSSLLRLGNNPSGGMQVPDLQTSSQFAAWYKYSVTPGQLGASVILGHVDSYGGPAVFFRLGAIRPGDTIDVTLADGVTAVFRVTGVRTYPKSSYPSSLIYSAHGYSGLRLITCGGDFDYSTGHYLSSVVVFAVLQSWHH
ncbi:MAG: class F sortase [Streptosporangiaceae bacterium]